MARRHELGQKPVDLSPMVKIGVDYLFGIRSAQGCDRLCDNLLAPPRHPRITGCYSRNARLI